MLGNTKILVLFIVSFVVFVSGQMAFHYMIPEMTSAASQTGISANFDPIMDNIVTAFKMIFGILSIGLAFSYIISIAWERDQPSIPEDYRRYLK